MDDKWFVYFEDGWLYFHRSWVGFCIFALRLEDDATGMRVIEAWANRDGAQYRSTDADADAALVGQLVDMLLLR